jgi:hypothetical protein
MTLIHNNRRRGQAGIDDAEHGPNREGDQKSEADHEPSQSQGRGAVLGHGLDPDEDGVEDPSAEGDQVAGIAGDVSKKFLHGVITD